VIDPNTGPLTEDAHYTIVDTRDDGSPSNYLVEGSVTITNPNTTRSITVTGVTDPMGDLECDPEIVAAGLILGPKGTIECEFSYTATGNESSNTVTVATTRSALNGSDTATFDFNTNRDVVDEGASVGDSMVTLTPSAIGDDTTYEYDVTFTCDDEGGNPNTASVEGDDSGATSTAEANVNVVCLPTWTPTPTDTPVLTATASASYTPTVGSGVKFWCSPGYWINNYLDIPLGSPWDIRPFLSDKVPGYGDTTVGDVLSGNLPAGVPAGEVNNAMANYIAGKVFSPSGTQSDWGTSSSEPCPIDAHGVWVWTTGP